MPHDPKLAASIAYKVAGRSRNDSLSANHVTNRAAGVVLIANNGQALFLKRGPAGDFPGTWCFPGGHIEGEETPEEAAKREFKEELGVDFNGKLAFLLRNVSNLSPVPIGDAPITEATVDYTTFIAKGGDTFEPKLNDEHVGYAWAPIDQPPEPMHPGCTIAIRRMSMDELDIARAIRDGEMSSPQRYMNVSLFALRVTGTGTSYRSRDNEFVYRRPENYLNPDFLERCNGLTVILEHPKKTRTLTSEEFNDKAVGSIMLPYVAGDEVWGIAKIYDAATAVLMEAEKLSTSPAVAFRHVEDNTKMMMDGQTVLIEGKPSLLDHLAICERGVWDKGEEPSGIRVDSQLTGAHAMTPEELKAKADAEAKEKADAEAKAKADAAGGQQPDKMLEFMDKVMDKLDSVCGRMDSFEAKEKEKADAEEADKKAKADAAKSDEEKAKEKADAEAAKEKADAEAKEKADAEDRTALRKRIDAVETKLPKVMTDAELETVADVQAKADAVYQSHGIRAPRIMDGETVLSYRKRLAGGMQKHSKGFKDSKLGEINDMPTFDSIERQVYADAMAASMTPADLPAGQLRKVVITDPETNRSQIHFRGTQTFIHGMRRNSRLVTGFNTRPQN